MAAGSHTHWHTCGIHEGHEPSEPWEWLRALPLFLLWTLLVPCLPTALPERAPREPPSCSTDRCSVYSNCHMRIPANLGDVSFVYLHGLLWLSGFEHVLWGKGRASQTGATRALGKKAGRWRHRAIDREECVGSDPPILPQLVTLIPQSGNEGLEKKGNQEENTGRGLWDLGKRPTAIR